MSAKPTMAILWRSTWKRWPSASIIAMLRAADSSQLLRKRAVWMGTESVWPSMRNGFEMAFRASATFSRMG